MGSGAEPCLISLVVLVNCGSNTEPKSQIFQTLEKERPAITLHCNSNANHFSLITGSLSKPKLCFMGGDIFTITKKNI